MHHWPAYTHTYTQTNTLTIEIHRMNKQKQISPKQWNHIKYILFLSSCFDSFLQKPKELHMQKHCEICQYTVISCLRTSVFSLFYYFLLFCFVFCETSIHSMWIYNWWIETYGCTDWMVEKNAERKYCFVSSHSMFNDLSICQTEKEFFNFSSHFSHLVKIVVSYISIRQ